MSAPQAPTYDDGLVQLDRFALTLRRYHFPSGTAMVIPLSSVQGYQVQPLGWLVNRFSIWGRPDFAHWQPLDIWRPIKSTLITLDVPGQRPSPAFTPTKPDQFVATLEVLLKR